MTEPKYPKPRYDAEVVECTTQAQMEKALKAAKIAKLLAGTFSLICATTDAPKIILVGEAKLSVESRESSTASVVSWGSSTASVVSRGSSTASVESWGSSTASVVSRGSSTASVVSWESSTASVVSWESSTASVVSRESSTASVVSRGSSTASVESWGSSTASVESWESSTASVVSRGSSTASVESWESSTASVESWESSTASVESWGYSMVQAKGARTSVNAAPTVAVNLWDGATAVGGRQQVVTLVTPEDWCGYYGVRIEGEFAIVYKGVRAGYLSYHGGDYTPGTMPEDKAWNGLKGECQKGCGLNFSPTPRHTHEFESSPAHYLECRIGLDEMVVHFGGSYPQKCTARRVAAPLIEVDVNGKPIAAPVPTEAAI